MSGPVHIIAENTIFHESNLLITVYGIVSRVPGYYFQPLASTSPHVSGHSFTGTSCQARDRVPLFTGFSLMRAWVTQPSPGYNSFGTGKFRDPGGDAQYLGSLYRDPVSSFSFALVSSLTPATSSSNPRVPISTSPNHVRIQPSRPVGGFFCHEGGYRKAPRGEVSDPRNPSSASRKGAGYSYPQIRREGSICVPLPPWVRVRA